MSYIGRIIGAVPQNSGGCSRLSLSIEQTVHIPRPACAAVASAFAILAKSNSAIIDPNQERAMAKIFRPAKGRNDV